MSGHFHRASSRPRWFALSASIPLALASCGGGGDSPQAPDGGATRPTAPANNDPDFAVTGLRSWYLIGNDLTPGDDQVSATITPPAGVSAIAVWIADRAAIALEPQGGGFALALDITDLPAGDHEVLFAADGAPTAFASYTLHRSHPIYVMVTTDWDFGDPSDQALARQDRLHAQHPDLVMTHFVGPYTFTDPTVSESRRQLLADWVKEQRDSFGDEIGLHIHPYCSFVDDAGLTCITDQSTTNTDGDDSGYSIKVAAYGEQGFLDLLEHADEIFAERELGKPVTFRAGGWTASIETLRALEADGFVADTSANNWARMEEWMGLLSGELYDWNMAHWSMIGDTSQPYYPNDGDIQSDAAPTLEILEVPDNGIMVDYVTVEEMIEIFDSNWPGGALSGPRSFMMGFHPSASFDSGYEVRVDGILDYAEQFLASDDHGPVVHALLRDMPEVWKAAL